MVVVLLMIICNGRKGTDRYPVLISRKGGVKEVVV